MSGGVDTPRRALENQMESSNTNSNLIDDEEERKRKEEILFGEKDIVVIKSKGTGSIAGTWWDVGNVTQDTVRGGRGKEQEPKWRDDTMKEATGVVMKDKPVPRRGLKDISNVKAKKAEEGANSAKTNKGRRLPKWGEKGGGPGASNEAVNRTNAVNKRRLDEEEAAQGMDIDDEARKKAKLMDADASMEQKKEEPIVQGMMILHEEPAGQGQECQARLEQ